MTMNMKNLMDREFKVDGDGGKDIEIEDGDIIKIFKEDSDNGPERYSLWVQKGDAETSVKRCELEPWDASKRGIAASGDWSHEHDDPAPHPHRSHKHGAVLVAKQRSKRHKNGKKRRKVRLKVKVFSIHERGPAGAVHKTASWHAHSQN
jgi:hypothetical protein